MQYANGRNVDAKSSEVGNQDASSSFGRALLARDLNGDGFTDLVVSNARDNGTLSLSWIYGSTSGLDLAGAVVTTTDAYPGIGASLALVTAPKPMLVVGSVLHQRVGCRAHLQPRA